MIRTHDNTQTFWGRGQTQGTHAEFQDRYWVAADGNLVHTSHVFETKFATCFSGSSKVNSQYVKCKMAATTSLKLRVWFLNLNNCVCDCESQKYAGLEREVVIRPDDRGINDYLVHSCQPPAVKSWHQTQISLVHTKHAGDQKFDKAAGSLWRIRSTSTINMMSEYLTWTNDVYATRRVMTWTGYARMLRKFDVTGVTRTLYGDAWASAEIFPEGGANPPTLKKVGDFSARRTKNRPFSACQRRKRTF